MEDAYQELEVLLHARYIVEYIGVGGSGDISLRNAESARKVLNSTFLVQEYVEGGNLRNQVLEQVKQPPHASPPIKVASCDALKDLPLNAKGDKKGPT